MTNGTRHPELITAFLCLRHPLSMNINRNVSFPTPCSSNFKSVFVFFARGPARRETRVHTRAQNTTFEATIIAKFVTSGRTPSSLDVRTLCCMCEPLETARSLGDDTHAVATRPQEYESTDCAFVCWSSVWMGGNLASGQLFEQEGGQSVNVRQ